MSAWIMGLLIGMLFINVGWTFYNIRTMNGLKRAKKVWDESNSLIAMSDEMLRMRKP